MTWISNYAPWFNMNVIIHPFIDQLITVKKRRLMCRAAKPIFSIQNFVPFRELPKICFPAISASCSARANLAQL